MRLIPGKTKVQIELFKGISVWDILISAIGIVLEIAVLISNLPYRFYIMLGILIIFAGLLVRLDTTPNYTYLLHILRHFAYKRHYERTLDDEALLLVSGQKDRDEAMGEFFELAEHSEQEREAAKETKAQRKQRKKAEAALYKEEARKLKDKKVSEEEKNEIWKARAERSAKRKQEHAKEKAELREDHPVEDIMPFTDIKDGYISYDGKYYGAVLEIPAVEFRFFSKHRRNASIEAGVGKVLRNINPNYCANIVKIDRCINYDQYLDKEYDKLDELRRSFESGLLSEEELKPRVEVLYDRLNELNALCYEEPVVAPFYYIVLYEADKRQLDIQVKNAIDSLRYGEIEAHRLDDQELAVFLKYTNEIDFDERQVEKIRPEDYAVYAMPQTVEIKPRTVEVNHMVTHNFRVSAFPSMVDDAWLATVMSMPATKVVVKCKPMERDKAMRVIDRSLGELRGQLMTTGLDSKVLELQEHIATLSDLLATLQQENENLLQVNIYVTAYDIAATRANPKIEQPPVSRRSSYGGMKKMVRRLYQEHGFRLSNLEFNQMQAFIGSQISGYDPLPKEARGIPSNSVAAAYPWVFANVSDEGGMKLGSSEGVPVFLNFFRRDSERVNSNMVIVGKSGSGKSFATKNILANLAAEDAKIFILDPENEYSELAKNLHGKFINVGNAQQGRINPFQIITALDDDEEGTETVTGSYATHLQFLEEFFRQILPDCDKDALEYLSNLVDRMYTVFGITAETDLSKLTPEDYPIFDDLYDAVLSEFQQTDNEYIRTMLRTLMNYIAKFSTGGRNANIWNGPSTITTDENFTVFNFQSLLANRNGTIANAQMLLVLKYIDNEIIKNKDYNTRYHLKRKVVVAIDEAHVFIDTKFPVALDFMFQLAKRIRKYNGMQIVITQNIKDFVGSEEIARKSTAIINACQYSLIFALAPNDMDDLCTLYAKAGGINEMEQEKIITAPRGHAFTVLGPTSRSSFRVEVPDPVVDMFQNMDYESRYFIGEGGEENWENFVGNSRELWLENRPKKKFRVQEEAKEKKRRVIFSEVTGEEAALEAQIGGATEQIIAPQTKSRVIFEEVESEEPKRVSFEEVEAEEPKRVAFEEAEAEEPKRVAFEEVAAEPAATSQNTVSFGPETSKRLSMTPPEPTELEKILMKTLGQFSHATMLEEIRKAVREEVLREIREQNLVGVQERAAVPETEMPQEEYENISAEQPLEERGDTYAEQSPEEREDIYAEQSPEERGDIYAEQSPEERGDAYAAQSSEEHGDIYTEQSPEESKDIYAPQDASDAMEEIGEKYDTPEPEKGSHDLSWLLDDEDAEDDEMLQGDPTDAAKGSGEFNLMDILMEQAADMDDIGPIEMMDVYDEEVVDVTIEELVAYIRKMRIAG